VSDDRRVLILVVEQDPFVKALETALLQSWGYTAVFAPDGMTAIELARQLHPRLLIAEILVPRLDGLQVCRQLKLDPLTRQVKILIFSALLAERRALEAGADAFLRKPLDKQVFLATVEQLLEVTEPAAGVRSVG
jgi:sigma-B regulation protein RsbU (phosphoserine phosphatase)